LGVEVNNTCRNCRYFWGNGREPSHCQKPLEMHEEEHDDGTWSMSFSGIMNLTTMNADHYTCETWQAKDASK
jgi:hypothetical protein